jgi:tetratricopeptide (TPR) repeat protein
LAPRNVSYYFTFGNTGRYVAEDPRVAAMETLAQQAPTLSVRDRIELHFALAKAYEDLERFEDSFRQLLAGNTLKRQQVSYNEAAALRMLDRIRDVFTPQLFESRQQVGEPSGVPVFIIGMPRSGTTLLEQILASHAQVFGGGELTYFADCLASLGAMKNAAPASPEPALSIPDNAIRKLGESYLVRVKRLAPHATRVVDKLPSNFLYAGLIHLALPNAAIIHTQRDPADTCLSCFSKLFTIGQDYSYDLAELGRYYRGYQALMEHWHQVLPPGRILDVRYEDLVTDPERQARRVVAHCGLDWDPHCLAFHRTERPVRTASAAQVREPIYRSAVGRWRAYEAYLDPLLTELGVSAR